MPSPGGASQGNIGLAVPIEVSDDLLDNGVAVDQVITTNAGVGDGESTIPIGEVNGQGRPGPGGVSQGNIGLAVPIEVSRHFDHGWLAVNPVRATGAGVGDGERTGRGPGPIAKGLGGQ